MDIRLKPAETSEKEVLFRLLQYSLRKACMTGIR